MNRQETLNEVRKQLGFVPGFAEQMNDFELESWFGSTKNFWMKDTALPQKTKALLGLASSASTRCPY